MSDEIFFNGLRYVSSAEAAEALGITRDYVARLCKRKEIAGKRVGGIWYVNNDSLRAFAIAQEYARAKFLSTCCTHFITRISGITSKI